MDTTAAIEIDAQYRALREHAGQLDRSPRGILAVTGPDAAELLQGQLTNDVARLDSGQGCYAALLDRKGRMRADMRVLRLGPEELWLDTEPHAAGAVERHMGMYKVGLDAEIRTLSGSRAVTSVIGPAASEAAGAGDLGPEHAHGEVSLDGIRALAVATDLGVDLVTAVEDVRGVQELLEARGVARVEEAAAEIVRVESGRPRFGKEMDERTMPAEAGIEGRAVSFTKGCYIGQETVARLHYRGKPNRHLRGLRLSAPARDGDLVRAGERELGSVGTAAVSPALGPVALAILRREAGPGDRVTVGDATEAEVVDTPLARE